MVTEKLRRTEETALMAKEEAVTKIFQISDLLKREVTETQTAIFKVSLCVLTN